MLVLDSLNDRDLKSVCIRETQRSLKFSAKSLIEAKIKSMGVEHRFRIMTTEVRRIGGDGVIIFEGMADHTADSIKSLEGFSRAWVEEAQVFSARSLELLLPTIRADDSEVWFSWNPDQPEDPVDAFFASDPPDSVCVQSTYKDNPFCPRPAILEAERLLRVDPDGYAHVWLGEYNLRSDVQVLSGKWRVEEFEPVPWIEDEDGEPVQLWAGPYLGSDFGFSQDPLVLVRVWVYDSRLWIEYDVGGVGVELDEIPDVYDQVPGAREHMIRADNSRPETISHLRGKGFRIEGAEKWKGSVEDGIAHLRGYEEIIIHPRCRRAIDEARLWRYKTDRLTGDALPKLQDGHEHVWDAVRYALGPLIRKGERRFGGYFPGAES